MKKDIDMLHSPLRTSIIQYAIPIILTGLMQLMFNAADMIIVGQYCGSIAVAAVSATGSITALLVNLFMGFSIGTGVSISQGLGGQDHEKVSKAVHTAVPVALISGGILSVTGVIFAEDLLRMMNTPEEVLPLSTIYMQIYFAGLIFSMVYNFCAAILRAAGDTKSPLYFLTIAGVVNVILNIIFVTLFHMNVAGVALATTISSAISAVCVVILLTKRNDACKLEIKKIHIFKKPLLEMIRFGLPAGIQSSLFSISTVFIQSSLNSFDSSILLSGNGAASNLEGFVYTVMTGFTQACVNFVGQNAGAHNFKRVKKVLITCLGYIFLWVGATGLIFWFFRRALLSLYITDSLEAIHYGTIRMFYIILPMFVCGFMNATSDGLRGLGAALTPTLISVICVCGIRFVWIFAIFPIPKFHTLESLYISFPITWIVTFLLHLIAFTIIFKKKARRAIQGGSE